MLHTHKCLKCSAPYSSEDDDAYYCEDCLVEKKRIAQEIDAKLAAKPREHVKSDYQIALSKGQRNNGALFVKASDLGLY